MSRAPSGIRLSLTAAGTLLVLLAVLATLQYRWIGEISEADQARMRASARPAGHGVATHFNLSNSPALSHILVSRRGWPIKTATWARRLPKTQSAGPQSRDFRRSLRRSWWRGLEVRKMTSIG